MTDVILNCGTYNFVLNATSGLGTFNFGQDVNINSSAGNITLTVATPGENLNLSADTINITSVTDVIIDSASLLNFGTSTCTALTLGNASCNVTMSAAEFQIEGTSLSYIDAPGLYLGTLGSTTTFNTGTLTTTTTITSLNLTIIADSGIGITANNDSIEITSTLGDVDFIAGANVTASCVEFQVSASSAAVFDAPSVLLANSAATNCTFGNSACTLDIAGQTINLNADLTASIDAGSELQLGQSDATTIQLGNASSTITINSTSFKIASGISTVTGTVAVPTHTPPAGYAALAINTTTGVIIQYAP